MKHLEKQNEIGFKIKEVNDRGSDFEVVVEPPVREDKRISYTFSKGSDWMDTKKFVDDDGEIKEEVKWKLRIKNNLKEQMKSEKQDLGLEEVKNHEGEKIRF